jgi:K+ channel tetramerisation domain.
MKNKTAARKSPYLSQIEKQISKRKAEMDALDERYESLMQRKKAMLERHGGQDVKPTDIIQLNVGGRDVVASRETLTAVTGSRLEDLFSGKWENRLIRDEKGHVFLDLDSNVFEQVLEYLYHFKMGLGEEYLAKHSDCTLFELYVDYFELRSAKKHGGLLKASEGDEEEEGNDNSDNENGQDDDEEEVVEDLENENKDSPSSQSSTDVAELIQKEVDSIHNYKKELDELEKSVNQDEDFVSYFLQKQDTDRKRSATKTASAGAVSDAASDIVYLLVQGRTIGVKRSTLCLDEDSILAQHFSDEAWIKEHSVSPVGVRSHILLEHPASSVMDMVNYLRFISMNIPKIKVDKLLPRYSDTPFWKMVRSYFPNENSPFSILNKEQKQLLIEWLMSRGMRSREKSLHLLFRASSDGWDFAKYRKMRVDQLKSSLTVIKTVDGYVLGGFDHCGFVVNNSKSFLFSLVNPTSLDPLEMKFRNQSLNSSPFRNLSSLCGPVFGMVYYGPLSLARSKEKFRNSHTSNVSKGFTDTTANSEVAPFYSFDPYSHRRVTQWQSNVDLGVITSLNPIDFYDGSLKPGTVGVDLCIKEADGKGYACIEHAYELPEGLPEDFMTGNADFDIADFEVYGVSMLSDLP